MNSGALLFAFAGLITATAIGRVRYLMAQRALMKLGLPSVERAGVRRAVVSSVAVLVPELEARLAQDPASCPLLLQRLHRIAASVAEEHGAEVECPDAAGIRVFAGRYRADPDHRSTALRLALDLQERLKEVSAAFDLAPPRLGVATGDTLSVPFPVAGATEIRTLGRGPGRAAELAREAGPGEVRVDEPRPAVDIEFRFRGQGGARLLLGEGRGGALENEDSEVGDLMDSGEEPCEVVPPPPSGESPSTS